MSLLFNDPLAFLPEPASSSNSPSSSGLRMLFQNWNQTQVGTFNSPAQNAIQQQRQLDQLEEVRARMEGLQTAPNVGPSRALHSRRISDKKENQLLEPIPVMDLDHPLNSWMLNTNTEHLGPLATRNNSDWPILPQFTVSALSNGTLVQIPVSLSSFLLAFLS